MPSAAKPAKKKSPARRRASSQGKRRREPAAPTLVLYVRHGQTGTTGKVLPGRARGLHLAETGRAQADRAAERIRALSEARRDEGSGIAAVYASPMERAQETAQPIARAVGRRVRTDAGLNECDFGEWTGKRLANLRQRPEWRTVQQYPSGFRFPKGESFAEMQTRMTGAVAALVQRHPGEAIVAVSHADTIKAALNDALGSHLDQFQRIVVSPCSISAVLYTEGGPVVLAANSTGDDLTTLVPS
jgi:probable phosphoglycerate mutase